MAGGRKSKPPAPTRPQTTLVLDNGAYTLKAGLVGDGNEIDAPVVIPNCIARSGDKTFVGADLDRCRDFREMRFRRPVEKGFIVNWESQKEIWDHHFFAPDALAFKCDPADTRLVLTEPPNGLPALQTNCDQVVFEEYGFASYYRGIGPVFNAYHDIQGLFQTPREVPTVSPAPAETLLVVDSGYSQTTVTPILRGQALHSAVRRLDIGGKFLTNYLTHLVSFRHVDVTKETHIVNEMKETACYVSPDFKADLEACWKGTRGERRPDYLSGAGVAKDYVLPDFQHRQRGILLDYDPARHAKGRRVMDAADLAAAPGCTIDDIVTLRNERFVVPELIFQPSDISMRQPGVADLIQESLHQLPVGLWPGMLANIVVVGGNTLFEGFIQRLQREVVQRVPDDCVVRIARPSDPIVSTWRGAANMARHANMEKLAVTKLEYEELGAALVARKFAAGINVP
ncbi:Actin-like protein arp-6 [Hirsutella minnesotensis 3608]|uniref:Actin-like protein ARP6 n=1 Tax=Hirsutella minnesotensis 3608 TaxID=1043627 RepID=A0A0F7ZVN3_9HYPO|nr:Actin-like protein arp-6 [Hirsutella minnesotensis 3608]